MLRAFSVDVAYETGSVSDQNLAHTGGIVSGGWPRCRWRTASQKALDVLGTKSTEVGCLRALQSFLTMAMNLAFKPGGELLGIDFAGKIE